MTSDCLYIAAKPPVPGQVKTRLARGIGAGASARLYAGFLEDLAADVRDSGVAAGWFIPPGAWVPPSLGPHQLMTRRQVGRSWSERQAGLFEARHRDGHPATVLIASDSPQLRMTEVGAQLREWRAELVLAPVHDGGYYLFGMRGNHDVLRGVEMSTADVSAEIARRAAELQLELHLLPVQFDVDEVEDLAPLAAAAAVLPHLRATRRALAKIGAGAVLAVTR
ncbi:MAG: TIGR04282 family arsenosugar biosynthesis glycosyltransferase [Candidatus Dormibacteria bacterium]